MKLISIAVEILFHNVTTHAVADDDDDDADGGDDDGDEDDDVTTHAVGRYPFPVGIPTSGHP